MERMRRLTDEQLEALLAGKTPAGTEGLEGLAAFVKSVPDALAHAPGEHIASAHLARMIEAVPSASNLATAGSRSPHGHARRRRTVLSTLFGTLAAKIAAITLAAAAATAGLAATGSLPPPAQNAVSSAASHVGVHFPKKGAEANESTTASTKSGEHASEGKALGKNKFEVTGVVVSAATTALASSPTTANATDHGRSDHSTKTSKDPDRTAAKPGSLTLTMQAGSDSFDSCGIKPGHSVVVSWTISTRFAPPKVVADPTFPANLAGKKVEAGGDITRTTGACSFVADKVAVSQGEAAESPDQGASTSVSHGEKTEPTPNPAETPSENDKGSTPGTPSGHAQDSHPTPNTSGHGKK
jgi:hypothetical protein